MKSLLAIVAYFYSSSRFIKPLAFSGLVFILPAIFISSPEFKTVFFFAGWVFTFAIPFVFVSQSSFWLLIANRRLSMVPAFHSKAGFVLFVFTLVVSQLTVLLSLDWSPLLAMRAFNIATFMLIVASLGQKTYGFSIWIPISLFSFDSIGSMFNTDIVQYSIFFICITAWVYGFIGLARRKDFRGLAINYLAILSTEDPFGESSKRFFKINQKESQTANKKASGVLYSPEKSIVQQLKLATIPMFILPLAAILMIVISNIYKGGFSFEISEEWIKLYLFFSMMTPVLISATYSKKVQELRQMWLRVEGTRSIFWNRLEQELRPELFGLTVCLLVNFAIAMLFTNLSLLNCIVYSLMVIGMYFYGVYIGCLIGCNPKSDMGSLLAVIFPPLIFCIPLPFLIDSPIGMLLDLLVFLTAIVLTRYSAKQKFTVIDWFSVNPFRQLSRQLYLRSPKLK